MRKTQMNYFKQDDVIHFLISDEKESNSVELAPDITAELNEKGELIGIEILNASSFIRDSIMDSFHVKLLNLTEKKAG